MPPHDWVQGEDVFECLRSGKSTLDVDTSLVLEDIALMRNTLSDMDHYLNHLDTLASRARKERAEIVKIIEAKQSLLSPIRRLNRDVLLIIFSYASDGTNNSLCMKNAPWTLLHTCHRWRRVVSSSPVLWSTLRLHVSRGTNFPSHALNIVKLQLRLSQNSPLRLFVNIDFDFRHQDAVISEVMSHSNRCYEVYIAATRRLLRKFIRTSLHYSQLRRLVISTCSSMESYMSLDAPKLTSLGLHGGGRVCPNIFPASNLCQFTGYFSDPMEFHTFISVATSLEKLGVQSIDQAGYSKPLIPVTLRRLHQLSYLSSSGTCPNYLVSPALRVLSVMQHVDDITAIAKLYSRSHFSLERLYLCHNFQFSAVAPFVETDAVRGLTHFHLEVDDSTASDWITGLTVTPSFCIFPNLSELTMVDYLSKSLSNPDNAQRYLAMVRSRLQKDNGAATCRYLESCLKKVDLCIWHPEGAEDIYVNGFRTFREGGLDANVHFSADIKGGRPFWDFGLRLCREIAGI
ncbi:uncharacterized protein ARMOST_16161 [Armillaria ostoyae]|uniref:Uncharacterized protein n=1 Tax=Armillaria ostoyae TaxID=47428 RepID=A0A284RVE5_ARMOS|nr:uncharacterized protein ARMOST_16161 [Armillaria ostoyae]